MIGALVALQLITLHMVDGRTIEINPALVTQVIHPNEKTGNKLVVPSAKCVIRMVGGYISVVETCEQVQQLMQGH